MSGIIDMLYFPYTTLIVQNRKEWKRQKTITPGHSKVTHTRDDA